MSARSLTPSALAYETRGTAMHALIRELYPICRSITGSGVRETLGIIGRHVPLRITELPSGLSILDWSVPNEWNIRGAWIARVNGERVIDFAHSNLHVVSYSTPVRRRISRAELDEHLHSLPEHPEWIPYRTSHYTDAWGFCLTERQREALTDPEYDVCIDARLEPGQLTYAECVVPGESAEEILLTTHICHPSLCNDNLSGIAVATFLLRELQETRPRHTLRVIFIPGTIGSIAWLAQNRARVAAIKHGLSLVCLGDPSPFTYKRTLHGSHEIDRVFEHLLRARGEPHQCVDYFPYGYDERQFNSPGFRVPMGSLMRARHGRFPEYHSSADNLEFVSAAQLDESLELCLEAIRFLDANQRYLNLAPYGEPQLGRRGVYRALGGTDIDRTQLAVLWVLALSDGQHDLLHIAERAGLPFDVIREAALLLERQALLRPLGAGSARVATPREPEPERK